uniref:Uncharacterized protein n=1 Tax=Rhizophora mucronata TaxID=61149 RepID=A0A2P2NAA8_RHIMU
MQNITFLILNKLLRPPTSCNKFCLHCPFCHGTVSVCLNPKPNGIFHHDDAQILS